MVFQATICESSVVQADLERPLMTGRVVENYTDPVGYRVERGETHCSMRLVLKVKHRPH